MNRDKNRGTSTVGVPFNVTVCPIVAVKDMLTKYLGETNLSPLIVVASVANTASGTLSNVASQAGGSFYPSITFMDSATVYTTADVAMSLMVVGMVVGTKSGNEAVTGMVLLKVTTCPITLMELRRM